MIMRTPGRCPMCDAKLTPATLAEYDRHIKQKHPDIAAMSDAFIRGVRTHGIETI